MTDNPKIANATAAFSDIFKQMQEQRAAWWTYLAFPNQYDTTFASELVKRIRAAFMSVAFISHSTVRERMFAYPPSQTEDIALKLGCWTAYSKSNSAECINDVALHVKEDTAICCFRQVENDCDVWVITLDPAVFAAFIETNVIYK